MGRRMGMRVGKRVGGVRVSAGRGGVRVGSGKSYGKARVGVSYSSRGGLGGGASYGTKAARVGTNGHGISVGLTAKTGMVSVGGGYGHQFNHGVRAPAGHHWYAAPGTAAGAILLTDVEAASRARMERRAARLTDAQVNVAYAEAYPYGWWAHFRKSPAAVIVVGLILLPVFVLIAAF